jgi:hypothetical protein
LHPELRNSKSNKGKNNKSNKNDNESENEPTKTVVSVLAYNLED